MASLSMRTPLLRGENERRERDQTARRSLGHSRLPFKLNIKRLYTPWSKIQIFFGDIFHSLIDLPRFRFFLAFLFIYLGQYFLFGLMYYRQSDRCIEGVSKYLHAVWFSVQTSRTIGYGSYGMAPNPDCTLVNVFVMFQTVVATFLDTLMFGVVFTRFSNPMLRKSNIQFSRHVLLHKRTLNRSQAWCLTCRVANIRAHGLLQPKIRMLASMKEDAERPSVLNKAVSKLSRSMTAANIPELSEEGGGGGAAGAAGEAPGTPRTRSAATQEAARVLGSAGAAAPADEFGYSVAEVKLPEIDDEVNKLTLGFPCSVTHIIDRHSPFFGLSVADMEHRRLELWVIVEGVDPATSNYVRGVRTYTTADVLMNRVFQGLLSETASGQIRLNLNDLDATTRNSRRGSPDRDAAGTPGGSVKGGAAAHRAVQAAAAAGAGPSAEPPLVTTPSAAGAPASSRGASRLGYTTVAEATSPAAPPPVARRAATLTIPDGGAGSAAAASPGAVPAMVLPPKHPGRRTGSAAVRFPEEGTSAVTPAALASSLDRDTPLTHLTAPSPSTSGPSGAAALAASLGLGAGSPGPAASPAAHRLLQLCSSLVSEEGLPEGSRRAVQALLDELDATEK